MNNHLNLFKSYARKDREFQLENDLTRAFAICLQEDNLFFHEVLKEIMNERSEFYNRLFEDYSGKSEIQIDIQQKVKTLENFEHLFAVSLSGRPLNIGQFFHQKLNDHDPICDLMIVLENVVIIFEVKPDDIDCTSQLFNQAYHACNFEIKESASEFEELVTPVDLNWSKLMALTVKIANFETAIGHSSRFLSDFIQYIQIHNFRWLPEIPISALASRNSRSKIERRLKNAIEQSDFFNLQNRLGFEINVPWAEEVLFGADDETGKLNIAIYPANTKSQGIFLFKDEQTPVFKKTVNLLGKQYDLGFCYHIKLTSFQKYFAGLWFSGKNLSKALYSNINFWKYSGRRKRGDNNWKDIENLFDSHFKPEFKWKENKELDWENKVINSGKSQFDLSFGYEISTSIPFRDLQDIDTRKDDLTGLIALLEDIEKEFTNLLVND